MPEVSRRATFLPSGVTITDAQRAEDCPVKAIGRYLYEPDGAVIRAGLVEQVGVALDPDVFRCRQVVRKREQDVDPDAPLRQEVSFYLSRLS